MLEEPIEIIGCHGTGSCVVIVIECNGAMEDGGMDVHGKNRNGLRGDNEKFKCMNCLSAQRNDRDLSKD